MNDRLVLTSIIISVWPALVWCFERYTDRSDDPLGVLSLIALAAILLWRYRGGRRRRQENIAAGPQPEGKSLRLLCFGLVLYSCSIISAGKTVQTLFALTLIGLAGARLQPGKKFVAGDWMLLYLALPVVASANFYLGYPLRIGLTELAAGMLRFYGFQVKSLGTLLVWNCQLTEVDTPCSGLKMLWFAVFLAASMSSIYQFRWPRALALSVISVVGALFANLLRVTSLFFIENGLLDIAAQWQAPVHQAVGASIFSLLAALIVGGALKFARLPEPDNEPRPTALHNAGERRAVFLTLCLLAALLPFFPLASSRPAQGESFSGWPAQFEGKKITPLPENEILREFSRDFPGRIALFTDGEQTICLRWIYRETRQLHPASDCYRGLGYHITFMPSTTDSLGNRWNQFSAERPPKRLKIRERIFDGNGQSFSDISAWYWAALLKKSRPPWWSVTVTSR